MVSIKALIASTLFASALAFPFGPHTLECTLKSGDDLVTAAKFEGKTVNWPVNKNNVRVIVDNDIPHEGVFQLHAVYDNEVTNLITNLTFIHHQTDLVANVTVFSKGSSPLLVKAVAFDGTVSETTTTGEFRALEGYIKYTVRDTPKATTIDFVINRDTFVYVSIGKDASVGSSIRVKQPDAYLRGKTDCQLYDYGDGY